MDEIFELPTSCINRPPYEEVISVGHKVILKKDKFYKIITVQGGDRLELCEKRKFRMKGAIGKPYESLFLIQGEDLIHVKDRRHFEDFEHRFANNGSGKSDPDAGAKDNRNLTASASNQTLQPEDISQMRAEGKTGTEIVNQLVENSASFAEKTAFSQAKYLKKKKKKHMELVTILRPTTRNLCEMYSVRGLQKILGLRIDSLAFLLAHANVHSGANVLLHETCAGLLIGSVLERLGGAGRLLHFHHGSAPPRPECHGLSEDALRPLLDIPLQEATALRLTCNFAIHSVGDSSCAKRQRLRDSAAGEKTAEKEDVKKRKEEAMDETEETPQEAVMEEAKEEPEPEPKPETEDTSQSSGDRRKAARSALSSEEQERRRGERRTRLAHARTALLYEPWNSLIVATKFHPTAPVLTLLHFLSPGAPFVVYCPRMEPLIDLQNCLKRRGEVVMVELTEGWFRPYQVLPNRTHPEMTLQGGGGGYILSGYKTCGPFGKMRPAEADFEEGLIIT